MAEVYIFDFIGNSKAGIQESKENSATCPSYPFIPVLVMAVLGVLVVAPIVLVAQTIF